MFKIILPNWFVKTERGLRIMLYLHRVGIGHWRMPK